MHVRLRGTHECHLDFSSMQKRGNMAIRSMTKIVALLLLAVGLYAQDRATLTGTVTDPSGAAIPNASVKAVNTANNATSEAKTTADGAYNIPYLIPGVYRARDPSK